MAKIKIRNVAVTIESFLQTLATGIRTWTLPDKNGTLATTDDVAEATPDADPTTPGVAKLYHLRGPNTDGPVDQSVHTDDYNQLQDNIIDNRWKLPAHAATLVALPPVVADFVNGTLTAVSNGALPAQDGQAIAGVSRLLVKNQVDQKQNNLYDILDSGSGGSKFVLRINYTCFGTGFEMDGAVVKVMNGTQKGNWVQTTHEPTVGVSNIVFEAEQVSSDDNIDFLTFRNFYNY